MPLSDEWLKTAAEITGEFETSSSNPWAAVTGDFDQMGISCGILQWNIGMGSLQPIIKEGGKAVALRHMPTHGEQLWDAAHSPIPEGLKIVRKWQTGTKLKAKPREELTAYIGSDEIKPLQLKRLRRTGDVAFTLAEKWCEAEGTEVTIRDFCWFFDLVTQNGSLKNLTHQDAEDLIAAMTKSKTDDHICDWLKSAPTKAWQRDMAKKNAALWRDNVKAADLSLFALSYLRSLKASKLARWLVMNRKGIFVTKKGWLNGKLFDLTARI
jgi:hypothetical protein